MKVERRLLPVAALAATYAGLALLLKPWRLDGPMNDDWAYLIPARRLAETGVLKLTDWAPATQALHVAWGALWIKLFGFDIGLLKLAMFGWSALSAWLLFKLLSEEGAPRSAALLASLALALNPVVVLCSLTFMTDVSYLAIELAALYALCRGLREDDDRWLAAGGAAAAAAFLIRQIGLLVPVGAAIELWRAGRFSRRRAALLFGPALAAAGGYWFWFRFIHGRTIASHFLVARMDAKMSRPLRFAGQELRRLAECAVTLGLFSLPLAAGLRGTGERSKAKTEWAANALLIAAAWLFALYGPLPYGPNAFQISGVGWVTVPGEPFKTAGIFSSYALWLALTAAAVAGAWLIASRAGEALEGSSGAGLRVLGWAAALQLAPSIAWATYFDRYLLPLLPFTLGLAALSAAKRSFSSRASVAALAALSALWLSGVVDYSAWNRAEARLVRRALARGVDPDQLAAGWDWDAFHNYERRTAALKAEKPVEAIGEWEWRTRGDRELLVTFEPHPETHWKGVELLDRESYSTPLSRSPGVVYLFKVASSP